MQYQNLLIKCYPKIEHLCRYHAFKFYLNLSDLNSLVNEKLCVRLSGEPISFDTPEQFMVYASRIVYSSACDLKRGYSRHGCVEMDGHDPAYGYDITKEMLAKFISSAILRDIKHPHHREVIQEVLVNGEPYEKTAVKLGMNISTVKTVIFQTRKKALAKYGRLYQEVLD